MGCGRLGPFLRINMGNHAYKKGVAFIVEGATERVFYEEYLMKLCSDCGMTMVKDRESQENKYVIHKADKSILILINNVGSVSQMTNSATWFHRACVKEYSDIRWSVFLCYDTDAYNSDITKFHEGDWLRLRQSIESDAEFVEDLAAQADIEDVMLCDFQGVLAFLHLDDDTPMPKGRKGKVRIKQLFRRSSPSLAYHEGERARALIRALDMECIEGLAPVPLSAIGKALEF